MRRLMRMGAHREMARLRSNRRLQSIIKANAAKTKMNISRMRSSFTVGLEKLRQQARRAQSAAAFKLRSTTSKLYAAIARNQAAQRARNKAASALTEATLRSARNHLLGAKREFRSSMRKLINKAAAVDRRQSSAYRKLTGIVAKNAAKSAAGRRLILTRQKAHTNELRIAINRAIHMGEKRSGELVLKMKRLDQTTRAALNAKISAEIGRAKRWASKSIEAVRTESKRERAALKRQLVFAISKAKNTAKNNLGVAMAKVNNQLAEAARLAEQRAAAAGKARALLSRRIATYKKEAANRLVQAVSGLNRARLALADQTTKKIKTLNRDILATANKFSRNVKKVEMRMQGTFSIWRSQMVARQRALQQSLKQVKMVSMTRATQLMNWQKQVLAQAQRRVNTRFKGVYASLAVQRKRADGRLAANVKMMNDAIAKQSALNDKRFQKTVKLINKAKQVASIQVATVSRTFRSAIVSVTATAKNVRTRLQGEINQVAGQMRTSARQQAILNQKVSKEMAGIVDLANMRWSQSTRARGKLRSVLSKHKQSAARMVNFLARKTKAQLGKVRAQASSFRRTAATDLSKATQKLYAALAKNKLAEAKDNKALKGTLKIQRMEAMTAILQQRKNFKTKLANLANTVAANKVKESRALARLTGVVKVNAATSKKDLQALREQRRAMQLDMKKAIARAIQIGELRASQTASRIAKKIKRAHSILKEELATSIERAADEAFTALSGNRMKIADNYLALKAYCVASLSKWETYYKTVGPKLSSVGDICTTVAKQPLETSSAPGVGMGNKKMKTIFSGKVIKGSAVAKRINSLVNEYVQTALTVRNRWPFGIGKYFLGQLQAAMQDKGCLEVSTVGGLNQVFINARAVGLTSRLRDFRGLGIGMPAYERALAQLTAQLAAAKKAEKEIMMQVKPPQWNGD